MDLNYVDNCDWLEYVNQIPTGSVDLIVTDPAYPSLFKWLGIGTTARMGMGKAGSGSDALDDKFFPVMDARDLPDMLQEFYRVLKPGGHAYIMSNEDTERDLWHYGVEEGVWPWYVSQGVQIPPCQRLVWVKRNAGMGYPFLRRYEFVTFFFKGTVMNRAGFWTKRKLTNKLGIPNVIEHQEIKGKAQLFPTQKPDVMAEDFIRWSSQPGDVVLDPFCGSGWTARAAKRLGRHFLTCDIWPRAIELARSRVEAVEFGEALEVETSGLRVLASS